MKNLLFFLPLLTFPLSLHCQTELNYDYEEKKIETKGVSSDKTSTLSIQTKNSSKLLLSVKTENQSFQLSTPDILKPLFIIPPGEAILSDIDKDVFLENLNFISQTGTTLYLDTSDVLIFRAKAIESFHEILKRYSKDPLIIKLDIKRLGYEYSKFIDINRLDSDYILDRILIQTLKQIIEKEYNFISSEHTALREITKTFFGKDLLVRYNNIHNSNYQNSLNSFSFIISALESNTLIISDSFKATKDILKIQTSFRHPITKDTLRKENFELIVTKKFQLSFSGGIFYNRMSQSKFYIESNSDTLSGYNFLRPENNLNADFSFGALGHISYRFNACLGLGLNLGAALSPYDLVTRYMVGGSILLGGKKQIVISGGLALAKMDDLSNQIIRKDNEILISKTLNSVPTQPKWHNSMYVGLSYNIFKTK